MAAGLKEIIMNIINPRKMTIWIILVIILLIIGGMYVYNQTKDAVKSSPDTNVPNANMRSKEAVFNFFYADWCPHCQTAKGPWNKFKSNYDGKEINGYKVKCRPVDCTNSDKNKTKMDEYNVDGFPTIKVDVDGSKIDFDAKITENSLADFLKTM